MPTAAIRSKNLDLIRWLNHGHENTAKKLAAIITNTNYLSKMATGDMEISDRKARSIEKTLDLPTGWLDRNNVELLHMTYTEFKLHEQLDNCSDNAKDGLVQFVSSVLQQGK